MPSLGKGLCDVYASSFFLWSFSHWLCLWETRQNGFFHIYLQYLTGQIPLKPGMEAQHSSSLDVPADTKIFNSFYSEKTTTNRTTSKREVEKLEQNNIHNLLFHECALNEHAALASGAIVTWDWMFF